ncbi:SH3 domain-containing protein [Cellulosimicrobium funkei]
MASVAMATALATGLGGLLVAPSASAAAAVVAPLGARTYSVSSYYGPRCMPVASASTWHLGQDLGATSGTRINAIADGTVLRAGSVSGFGQWVVLRHTIGGKTVSSVYGHVIDGDKYVKAGQTVKAGQRIADVGSTGISTSPHLHLEVWNGTYGSGASHTDPLAYLKGKGVDLGRDATRVAARSTATSCTYYTNAAVDVRAGAGTGAVVARVARGATVVGKPGDESGTWRRVTSGRTTGWVPAASIGPTKPAPVSTPPVTKPSAPQPATRYVTAASLNLRASATTSSAVVARLPKGTKLAVASTSGGWLKVTANGRTGWVSAQYTSTSAPAAPAKPAPAPPQAATSYVTASSLNLRASASTSSKVVARLARGSAVTHAGTASKGWLKVTAGGRTGFVSTAYLSAQKPR